MSALPLLLQKKTKGKVDIQLFAAGKKSCKQLLFQKVKHFKLKKIKKITHS